MNIDDVVLNFTPGTLVILNVVLGLIMFGILALPGVFAALIAARLKRNPSH